MSVEFTQYIDLAQVTLYAFWVFFAGLIYWLRMEDRREGYPLESDTPVRVGAENNFLFPKAKLFYKPEGGTYAAPNFERDTRPIEATRSSPSKGSPLLPNGDPLLSGVGPASYAQRHDEPELTREGHHAIVPMRVAKDYAVSAGPDPRGFALVMADGKAAGTIVDLWVDRAEMQIRYLEVELTADAPKGDAPEGESDGDGEEKKAAESASPARRLVPITVVLVDGEDRKVRCSAIHGHQVASVPTTRSDESITLLEEERIQAFYAGGYLYADARRAEPLV
jgi:photosynthetic reaction center H subunit